jgi:hypothetical protein
MEGIYATMISVILGVFMKLYNALVIKKHQQSFNSKVHVDIEKDLIRKFTKRDWVRIRKIDKTGEFGKAKNKLRWPLKNLIEMSLRQGVQFFPTFGYSLWILWKSPLSFVMYVCVVAFSIKLFKKPSSNIDEFYNMWEDYNKEDDIKFYKTIHHQGDDSVEKHGQVMERFEKLRSESQDDNSLYKIKIEAAFALMVCVDLYMKIGTEIDATFITIYIQYVLGIGMNLNMIGDIYSQYTETKREYDSFEKLFKDIKPRLVVHQVKPEKEIKLVANGNMFKYKAKSDKQIPFCIKYKGCINFKLGTIVKFSGDISNGKSTLMDIITGVISFTECFDCNVYIDNYFNKNGFDAITKSRLYCEQEPKINWKPSIYEIVSDQKPVFETDKMDQLYKSPVIIKDEEQNKKKVRINKLVEDCVWWALEQSTCDDFCKRTDTESDKKWIYTENVDPSPGLKACIRVAQIFYRLATGNYSIFVGDEVDKSVDPVRAVKGMTNLYKFCRENNILGVVSAHTTEVKNMKYDMTVLLTNGQIKLI